MPVDPRMQAIMAQMLQRGQPGAPGVGPGGQQSVPAFGFGAPGTGAMAPNNLAPPMGPPNPPILPPDPPPAANGPQSFDNYMTNFGGGKPNPSEIMATLRQWMMGEPQNKISGSHSAYFNQDNGGW